MFSIYNKVTRGSLISFFFLFFSFFFLFLFMSSNFLLFYFYLLSSYYLVKSNNYIITTVIIILLSLLLLRLSLLQLLFWLILPAQLFLRNLVGESFKQGIQAAWSTPIHHVKWWISRFRGIYRALAALETWIFLILLKGLRP